MEFKIGDEIETEGSEPSKLKVQSKLPIILIIVLSLVVGLGVFFISNSLFGPKEKPKPVERQKLSLNESNVEILYSYVTYGVKNTRGEKFIKESKTTLDSFTNEEKFYYALQFADVEDFEFSGKTNDKNQKIYIISNSKIRNYMTRFFGSKVTYTTDDTITYPFSFRINGQNVGTLKYSKEDKGFATVFDGYEPDISEASGIKKYYTELVAAYKELDGTYTLEEKIVYTDLVKNDDNTYNLSIYKDYDHKSLLETKNNLSDEEIKNYKFDIRNYKNKASTITYRFGLNLNTLYFESSTIKN